MTYSLRSYTREYIEKRAKESNIPIEKLGLATTELENLYEIAVIYDGALDEEFTLEGLYAVNVADWVAETCRDEAEVDADHPDWEVILSVPTNDYSETVYRVKSANSDY